MSLSEHFLSEVQIFVTDLGITESVLGSRSVGDSDVIGRLRRGQSITLRTADRITTYMAAERIRRAEPVWWARLVARFLRWFRR